MSKQGKVAILDIDYHHGNGQQNIFYDRADVLTLSLHGDPGSTFPYFSGFKKERGTGIGKGFNINFPLPENVTPEIYIETLAGALQRIYKFDPEFLVIALGFDTARGDPTGTWSLEADVFFRIGRMIGDLPFSTLFVQEGGYKMKTLSKNVRAFFRGMWKGSFE
ncbi:MAG: hypothetical protein Q7J16_12000 [Candidatus Cloacimonadales bacterium]|nr:hypothetical protein [Candidatus Cloacimonadales bacterium]